MRNPAATRDQIRHDLQRHPNAEPLRWAPPTLTDPITVKLTNTNRAPTLAAGQDYIIEFPPYPITTAGGVVLNGGRNLVIKGGEIRGDQRVNPLTGQQPSGFPRRTITRSASTMTVTHAGQTAGPFGAATTAAEVKDALEALPSLGPGSVLSATGPAGGPWIITPSFPNYTFGLLVGSGGTANVGSWGDMRGMIVLRQTGVVHIEGLWIHGRGVGEGLDVELPNATLRMQSCRIEPEAHDFHHDLFHGDGIQMWQGPSQMQMHRCSIHSAYQGMIGQPVETGSPGTLDTWYFEDVDFVSKRGESGQPPVYPLIKDASPGFTGWTWDMQNAWAYSPDRPANQHFLDIGGGATPAGLTVGQQPPEFCTTSDCGTRYVSPGYR